MNDQEAAKETESDGTAVKARSFIADMQRKLRLTVDFEAQVEQTSRMISDLINSLHSARRNGEMALHLKHRVHHASGDPQFFLQIEQIESLDLQNDYAMLERAAAQHLLGINFQFNSPTTGKQHSIGIMVICLLVAGRISEEETADDAALRNERDRVRLSMTYTEPVERRQRTHPIGWLESTVQNSGDRTLVLELLDDVYNIQQATPSKMLVTLEPILRESFVLAATLQKKRKAAHDNVDVALDEESSDAATVAQHFCIGYNLQFVGVPSFDDNFLHYLRHKYASRWLNAVIVFPHRKGGETKKQELAVAITSHNALASEAKHFAIVGAKRLCKKLYKPGATVPLHK